ncbi:MAG: single-stranded DNA-binding protein [Streptosporangiales bacterium]|nr:single-stranded DNA-binding protein [Streptosporangiales bacterium]
MITDTPVTVVGNLTDDPETRFTANGIALSTVTIASTPRRYDKATGQWGDGETLFLRGTCWRDVAEHVAESVSKGDRVIASGRLRQSSWETPEGEKRSRIELDIEEIGPSLRWATARPTRATRTTTGDGTTAPANDPWATGQASTPPVPANAGAGVPGFTDDSDKPPF